MPAEPQSCPLTSHHSSMCEWLHAASTQGSRISTGHVPAELERRVGQKHWVITLGAALTSDEL